MQIYDFFPDSEQGQVISIDFAFEGAVEIEQFQATLPVKFAHKAFELVTATENLVELVVPEADETIVLNGATVVNLVDIGPHTST